MAAPSLPSARCSLLDASTPLAQYTAQQQTMSHKRTRGGGATATATTTALQPVNKRARVYTPLEEHTRPAATRVRAVEAAATSPARPQPQPQPQPQPRPAPAAAAVASSEVVTGTTLQPFDCWTHLLHAHTGPGPLCLLMDAADEDDEEAAAAEDDAHPPVRVLAPCYLRFINEHMRDVPAPPDFFVRPSPAARTGKRKPPLHSLQHLIHALLYRRDFEAPVEHAGMRVYSARRRFDDDEGEEGRRYASLARAHGATLLEPNGPDEHEGGCCYLFAVQMLPDSQQQGASAAAADDSAMAEPAAPSFTPTAATATAVSAHDTSMRKRARARKTGPAAAAEEEEEVDMTASSAAPEPPSKPPQARRGKQTVLRRVVQRRRRDDSQT